LHQISPCGGRENLIKVFASVRTNVIKLRIIENELSKRRLIFLYFGA